MKSWFALSLALVVPAIALPAAAMPGDACQGLTIQQTQWVTPTTWPSYAANLTSETRYLFAPGSYTTGIHVVSLHDISFVAMGVVELRPPQRSAVAAVRIEKSENIELSQGLLNAPTCDGWQLSGPRRGVHIESSNGCIGLQGIHASGHDHEGIGVWGDASLEFSLAAPHNPTQCTNELNDNGGDGLYLEGAGAVIVSGAHIDRNVGNGVRLVNATGELDHLVVEDNGGGNGCTSLVGDGVRLERDPSKAGHQVADWNVRDVQANRNCRDGIAILDAGTVSMQSGLVYKNGRSGVVVERATQAVDLLDYTSSYNGVVTGTGDGFAFLGGTQPWPSGVDVVTPQIDGLQLTADRNGSNGVWAAQAGVLALDEFSAEQNVECGVLVDDAAGLEVTLGEFVLNGNAGIYVASVGMADVAQSTFLSVMAMHAEGNGSETLLFHDNPQVAGGSGVFALYLNTVGVGGNTFAGPGQYAVRAHEAGELVVAYNDIEGYTVGVVSWGSELHQVYENDIRDSLGNGIASHGDGELDAHDNFIAGVADGHGIISAFPTTLSIHNNVISGVGWDTWSACSANRPANWVAGIGVLGGVGIVSNNTVDHVRGAGIRYFGGGQVDAFNNLAADVCYAAWARTSKRGYLDGYHGVLVAPFGGGYVAVGSVAGDPQFVQPGPFSDPFDAQLSPGSVMEGVGLWIPSLTPTSGFRGSAARGYGNISIGAFEAP